MHSATKRVTPPALISGLLLLTAAATAQPAPGNAVGEAMTLSPFEITADRDVGYRAATTMAGMRTGDDLKNVPVAVTVLNQEFLEDIGASDIFEASRYATGGEFRPTSDTDVTSFQFRGFRTAWQTRNFFIWYLPADAYNYERIDIMRGPNAVLLGDAEPGGALNVNTKRAQWKHRNVVGFRVGSWDQYRGTLDLNRVLTDNLAVRVNAVYDDRGSWMDWVGETRKAAHLAATYRLGRNTEVRLDAEYGNLKNRPAISLPVEQYSLWNGAPFTFNTGAAPTGTSRLSSATGADYWVYDAVSDQILNWRGFGQTNGTVSGLSEPVKDESIHPREMQLTGPDMRNDRDYSTTSLFLEHRVGHDLNLELAYSNQYYELDRLLPSSNIIRRDPNPTMPGGAANPHFGEEYIEFIWQQAWQDMMVHNFRATAVYDFDRLDWTKQRVVVAAGHRDEETARIVSNEVRTNNTANPSLTGTTNRLYRRVYLSDGRDADATGFVGLLNDGPTNVETSFAPIGNMDTQYNRISYLQASSAGEYFGGRLRSMLGVRHDWAKNRIRSATRTATTGELEYTVGPATILDVTNTSLSAGGVYQVTDGVSLFANYSESFRPANQNVLNIHGVPPGPRLGEGKELGVRLDLLDNRLLVSASTYDITQRNSVLDLRTASVNPITQINAIWTDSVINDLDPAYSDNQLISGANMDVETVRGRGYELEIFSNLSKSWTLQAGYGYVDNEIDETALLTRAYLEQHLPEWDALAAGNPAIAASINPELTQIRRFLDVQIPGSKAQRSNKHSVNFFTKYTIRSGPLKDVSIGGGGNYRSGAVLYNTRVDDQLVPVYGEAHFVLNALVSYRFRPRPNIWWSISLNVNNVLDEDYFDEKTLAQTRYSTPRNFTLTNTISF